MKFLENTHSRQATKLDLVDIARALGIESVDTLSTVPTLRLQIRARLYAMAVERGEPVTLELPSE